jgi:hypothetical protein
MKDYIIEYEQRSQCLPRPKRVHFRKLDDTRYSLPGLLDSRVTGNPTRC